MNGKCRGVVMYLVSRARPMAACALGAAILATAALGVGLTKPGQPAAQHRAAAAASVTLTPGVRLERDTRQGPSTTAQCRRSLRIACYSPVQVQRAYDLPALYSRGITGKGATIVIVDPYGSPTIADDLRTFDQTEGVPGPSSLQIIRPAGRVPAYDPDNSGKLALGQRDHAGRGVRAHDRARCEDPAGRDAGQPERRDGRHDPDRRGREVRDQAPPGRRDQPELRGDRTGRRAGRHPVAARRLPGRLRGSRHRAGRRR